MVEVVQMSLKEADRYAVIQQVIQRTMGQSDAALWLNISVRQVKRLVRAIRQDGAQGAVSKRWGVPGNRRIPQAVRHQFVGLVRDRYSDFGPTLACEYLTAQHGCSASAETLRTWMIAAGLWKAKRTRVRRIHSPRERRSCRGELVQIDGSPHAWFEDRAPKSCLIAFIDDATGDLMQACFYPVQSTQAYLHSLQCYVSAHGRPQTLYSDRHSIFTKHDPEDPAPTQFERAAGELNIESILAYSPQAKGRVERVFQTLQDRLWSRPCGCPEPAPLKRPTPGCHNTWHSTMRALAACPPAPPCFWSDWRDCRASLYPATWDAGALLHPLRGGLPQNSSVQRHVALGVQCLSGTQSGCCRTAELSIEMTPVRHIHTDHLYRFCG